MATDDSNSPDPAETLEDETVEALHEVELGVEWLQRANGHLLEFHHATGHAMDHLFEAERHLRAADHDDLADALLREHLPCGVVDEDRWSYDVVEEFQAGVLADVVAFEETARESLAGGRRHVAERRQERDWKRRARGPGEGEREPDENAVEE